MALAGDGNNFPRAYGAAPPEWTMQGQRLDFTVDSSRFTLHRDLISHYSTTIALLLMRHPGGHHAFHFDSIGAASFQGICNWLYFGKLCGGPPLPDPLAPVFPHRTLAPAPRSTTAHGFQLSLDQLLSVYSFARRYNMPLLANGAVDAVHLQLTQYVQHYASMLFRQTMQACKVPSLRTFVRRLFGNGGSSGTANRSRGVGSGFDPLRVLVIEYLALFSDWASTTRWAIPDAARRQVAAYVALMAERGLKMDDLRREFVDQDVCAGFHVHAAGGGVRCEHRNLWRFDDDGDNRHTDGMEQDEYGGPMRPAYIPGHEDDITAYRELVASRGQTGQLQGLRQELQREDTPTTGHDRQHHHDRWRHRHQHSWEGLETGEARAQRMERAQPQIVVTGTAATVAAATAAIAAATSTAQGAITAFEVDDDSYDFDDDAEEGEGAYEGIDGHAVDEVWLDTH